MDLPVGIEPEAAQFLRDRVEVHVAVESVEPAEAAQLGHPFHDQTVEVRDPVELHLDVRRGAEDLLGPPTPGVSQQGLEGSHAGRGRGLLQGSRRQLGEGSLGARVRPAGEGLQLLRADRLEQGLAIPIVRLERPAQPHSPGFLPELRLVEIVVALRLVSGEAYRSLAQATAQARDVRHESQEADLFVARVPVVHVEHAPGLTRRAVPEGVVPHRELAGTPGPGVDLGRLGVGVVSQDHPPAAGHQALERREGLAALDRRSERE